MRVESSERINVKIAHPEHPHLYLEVTFFERAAYELWLPVLKRLDGDAPVSYSTDPSPDGFVKIPEA